MGKRTQQSIRKDRRAFLKVMSVGTAAIALAPIIGCGTEEDYAVSKDEISPEDELSSLEPIPESGIRSKVSFVKCIEFGGADNSLDTLLIADSDGLNIIKKEFINSRYINPEVSFSPDGKYLAYGNDSLISIINLENMLAIEIPGAQERMSGGEDISWSADSKTLLFGSYTQGIYGYDITNGNLSQIVRTEGYTYDHNPVMSPNLKKLAYVHHEYEKFYSIFIIDADGGNKQLITQGTAFETDEDVNLCWKDDSHLMFKLEDGRSQSKGALFDIDIQTGQRTVIYPSFRFEGMQLSPDRKTIALYSHYGLSNLFLVDAIEFLYGIANATDTGFNPSVFAWAKDSNYFIINSDRRPSYPLRIFDRELKEYLFNFKDSQPDKNLLFPSICAIDWSLKPV